MVEVYRHGWGDPDTNFSMLVSHILGSHGIEWHSNIIVSTKNRNVQACLEQMKAMDKEQLLKMKQGIIDDFKKIKEPEQVLDDDQRMEDVTNDCLCLAVASHVLDPEKYPLIPYTSDFFKVESPIKKRPQGDEHPRVISPVP